MLRYMKKFRCRETYERSLNIQENSERSIEHSRDSSNHPQVSDKYLRRGWGIIMECIHIISTYSRHIVEYSLYISKNIQEYIRSNRFRAHNMNGL